MYLLLLILHCLIAVSLICVVFIQNGQGAEMGAAFGSSSAQSMFGSRGAHPFLMKVTSILAALFFMSSLFLGYWVNRENKLKLFEQSSKQEYHRTYSGHL